MIFTLLVGYSTPPSAVNDPSVTKKMNSRKPCLEDLFPNTCIKVTLFYQYLVHLHGDFHRNESTKNLANSTMKKKKTTVTIVDFCELLLLSVSIAARYTMLV